MLCGSSSTSKLLSLIQLLTHLKLYHDLLTYDGRSSRFPSLFQFNERLLLLLCESLYSRWTRNFLHDSDSERAAIYSDEFSLIGDGTSAVSVWTIVEMGGLSFVNPAYEPQEDLASASIHPSSDIRQLLLWKQLYFRISLKCIDDHPLPTREAALESKAVDLQLKMEKMVPDSLVEDALDLIEYVYAFSSSLCELVLCTNSPGG